LGPLKDATCFVMNDYNDRLIYFQAQLISKYVK